MRLYPSRIVAPDRCKPKLAVLTSEKGKFLRALCDQHDVPGGPGEPAAVSLLDIGGPQLPLFVPLGFLHF